MLIFLLAAAALLFFPRKAGAGSGVVDPHTEATGNQFRVDAAGGPDPGIAASIQRNHELGSTAAATAGPAAAAASLALFPTLTATALTGIGAIVAGAVLLIDSLRTYVHLTANDFVQRFQNPFGAELSRLIDPHGARMRDGSETLAGASDTLRSVQFLWAQFQSAADAYSLQSNDAATVVKQGYRTLNAPNGLPGFPNGFINTVLSNLQGDVNRLAGGNPLSAASGRA